MAMASPAINFVLANEGGFVDCPNDSGGATNFGISLRFLQGLLNNNPHIVTSYGLPASITVETIKNLSQSQARMIYEGEFWTRLNYNLLTSQRVANYLFDCHVNHGLTEAVKLLQRATWAIHGIRCVKDDGIMGASTIEAVNTYQGCLAMTLPPERAGLMRLICERNSQDEEFLNGWLNRAYRI